MQTLDDAWEWYQATSQGMKRLTHIAKVWGRLPWEGTDEWVTELKQDNVLREVESDVMAKDAHIVVDPLADLALLVLFSVFEAIVRDLVEQQIRPEIGRLKHASLKAVARDVLDAVAEGSFFRVLEPFKASATNDLIEQVNQVRRYRNWVAHGRRPDKHPGAIVQPKDAYERLTAFLKLIRGFDPVELPPSESLDT